jgi:hypothetical protein
MENVVVLVDLGVWATLFMRRPPYYQLKKKKLKPLALTRLMTGSMLPH